MADRIVLYSLILVAFLLLATISYNNMMARRERQGPRRQETEEPKADWLCKFVLHAGSVVGETVAVAEGNLILKQAGVFKSVPKDQAVVSGDEVILNGDIDWDAAIAAGTAWHESHTQGQDDAVTAQLTRSEDVRHPALAALKRREGDEEE